MVKLLENLEIALKHLTAIQDILNLDSFAKQFNKESTDDEYFRPIPHTPHGFLNRESDFPKVKEIKSMDDLDLNVTEDKAISMTDLKSVTDGIKNEYRNPILWDCALIHTIVDLVYRNSERLSREIK